MTMVNLTNFDELGRVKGLKLVHLNVSGAKIDQNRIALQNNPIDIITLSETWLNPKLDSSLIAITGYKHYCLDRRNSNNKKRGGGLLIYVKSNLAMEVKEFEHLNSLSGDLECQWIEMGRRHAQNILICNLYRPPTGTVKAAFSALNKAMSAMGTNKKKTLYTGRFQH